MAAPGPAPAPSTPTLPPPGWTPLLVALAIGAAGGWLFSLLTLPLPWMLGAMFAVTAAALAGVRVRLPPQLRSVLVTVIGVLLGASFTPAMIARVVEWPVTLAGLALCSAAMGVAGWLWFRRVARYDKVTSYFAAAPGGLNEMILVGGAMGGDDRTIALNGAVRVFLVVFTIPIWFRFQTGLGGPGAGRPYVSLLDVATPDLAILAACAVAGALLGKRLRLPAAYLMGPMILSAAVHLGELTRSAPPTALVSLAQVVLGTTVGCRFAGVPLPLVGRTMLHAVAAGAMMIAIAIGCAVVADRFIDMPIAGVILAYVPGGLPEMSMVALALGIDAAFVAFHHIFRLLFVVTCAPLVFRIVRKRE
jgi:membrane AbrB-like protein